MTIEHRSVPLVKQVCGALEREVNNAVRSQSVTYSQIQLLLKLADTGTLPLKELEARLNVSQANIAGLTKRLERKGFIELLDDAHDRRVKHAKITARGLAKCDEAHEHMDAIELKLRRGLSELEAKLFYDLLRKCYGNLNG